MLAGIERAGLFLVPLDEVRGWWRYHHLFADLLRARLLAEQPGRVQALHRAAAAWCQEHGLADDAVRHALAAGDAAWAARLVELNVEALLGRSEGVTLRRWLSALPAESVRDRPRLCLAQAYSAAQGLQLEALEALLDDAERAFAVCGDEPYEPFLGPPQGDSVLANVPAGIAFLRASLARLRGDAALATGYNRQALAQLGEDDWLMRSFVAWNQAAADWLAGSGQPSAAWQRCSPSGRRPRSSSLAFCPCASVTTWARCSAPGATWMRPPRPAGKRSKRPGRTAR